MFRESLRVLTENRIMAVVFVVMVLLMAFCICIPNIYAEGNIYGTVRDDNNGNGGNIFIHSGEVQGGFNDVGTWTDIESIPELKGAQGIQGDTGNAGATGNDGANGVNGVDGVDGTKGTDGQDGAKGNTGRQGARGLQGRGLKDQYIGSVGLRLYDYQRHSATVSYGRDFNNKNNIVELRFTIKLGKSHTDRKIETLEKRLEELEK